MLRRNLLRAHQLVGQAQQDALWLERVLSHSTAGPSSSSLAVRSGRWARGLRTSLPARGETPVGHLRKGASLPHVRMGAHGGRCRGSGLLGRAGRLPEPAWRHAA